MSNLITTRPQAKILFSSIGPSGASAGIEGAVQFDPVGLPQTSGWKSGVYDLGTGDRNNLFAWRAKTKLTNTSTLGTGVEIFLLTSDDNSLWDGNLGSGHGVVTTPNRFYNAHYLGSILVDNESASGVSFITSGLVHVQARYISIGWWNHTSSNLTATSDDHLFQLTPVPDLIGDMA